MSDMDTKQFTSISAEVRYLIKKKLDDGIPHLASELRTYVLAQCSCPEKCTRGVFSGVFRDLIVNSDGAYISPKRGVYQKKVVKADDITLIVDTHNDLSQESSATFSRQIIQALSSASNTVAAACTVNLLMISGDDFSVVQRVQRILNDMAELRHDLEEHSVR
mgnify:CR=1 FL=1